MPIAKESGGDFTPVEAGTHLARCFACVALGVQESPNFPAANKVMLMFEVPEQTTEQDGEEVPMTVQKEYTLSLNNKATLRKHLEAWRGKPFTAEELVGFDVANVVGAPALLTIVHKVSANKKTYANIEAIAKPMKNMVCPPQHHAMVKYEIEMGRGSAFNVLPEWIQKKIAMSEEFKHPATDERGKSPEPQVGNATKMAAPSNPPAEEDDDNSIPF